MKWLSSILLALVISTTAYAQPIRPVASVSMLTASRQIAFQLSWVQREAVDSTMVAVFLSNDTVPVLYRRTQSPDTIRFTIPTDTTTYRFLLVNVRRNIASPPANVNFYFDADKYYVPSGLSVYPKTVTVDSTNTTRQVQFCAFIKFADGTTVIRDRDLVIPKCIEYYNTIPVDQRSTGGAKQRVANKMCLQWTTNGGTIENEVCS
jgi:hypothetical protein